MTAQHTTTPTQPITIIKVGGAIVEDSQALATLLNAIAQRADPTILVHGGGRTATTIAKQMGIETTMISGRRVTDQAMLDIVTMVYGGLVGRNIAAQLASRGRQAISLTGADLNIIQAHRRPITPEGIDYGHVGDIDHVNPTPLLHLLAANIIPILAPLTHDNQAHLLNTNADTIASTTAITLAQATTQPVHLTYIFDHPGVMRDPADPQSIIPHITPTLCAQLQAQNIITAGMIPKLHSAIKALQQGVTTVRITNIQQPHGGTLITL